MRYFRIRRPAKKGWVSAHYSATGYFGNEASETTFYTEAALVVKVPEFADGQRAQLDPSAVNELTKDHIWGDVIAKEKKKTSSTAGKSSETGALAGHADASEQVTGKKRSSYYFGYDDLPRVGQSKKF